MAFISNVLEFPAFFNLWNFVSILAESFAGLPDSWVIGEQECITDPLSSLHSNLMLAKASAKGFLISPENCSGSWNLKQGLSGFNAEYSHCGTPRSLQV